MASETSSRMNSQVSEFCLRPTCTIRDAIACIDHNRKGIALVIDEEGHLIGTVTDGDIRRAMLAGQNLDLPVLELQKRKEKTPYSKPASALVGTNEVALLKIMHDHLVHQVPIVDSQGRVVDLVAMDDLLPESVLPVQAVVMAGGFGQRLRPLTEELPKPMLPLGNRPLLERVIEQLSESGIRQVHLTTHYKGEMIEDHFKDGSHLGVTIHYVKEGEPLGTAGVLSLIKSPQTPLLIINGDILTRVNFAAMLRFHNEHEAQMTVGVKAYEFHIPYGVVEAEGVNITGILEKPLQKYFINAGIYLINPDICEQIPKGKPYDMPDLISELVSQGRQVISFPIREYWLDIGKIEDYQKAMEDIAKERV